MMPEHTRITLKLRTIYIIPSRHGVLFGLFLFVMLLGSINYSNSMGFMLTFSLAAMTLVSILHTYRNLSGLQIEPAPPEPVFAGEECCFPLWLDNQQQPKRYALNFRLHPKRHKPTQSMLCDVEENQLHCLFFPIKAQQRGHLSLQRLNLSTEFPLSLFHAWTYLDFSHIQAIVYPHPAGELPVPQGLPEHEQQSHEKGQRGDDFVGYRDYHPGDSPRHVDWKVVAREQGWRIKQFGGEEGLTSLWFNWHDVNHQGTEAALSQLCRWILLADAQNLHYGLRMPGFERPPEQGEAHKRACLQALALFKH